MDSMNAMTSMNNIKALLFDLDGTILDSKKSVIEAVFFTAEKFATGKFTYEDIEGRFGESFDEFMEYLDGTKEEIMEAYMNHMYKHHDELVALFEGVKEALLVLKKQGLKLAVVTNKQRDLTIRALDLFKVTDYFDTILTLDDVNEGKPNPEIIHKAMDILGVSKDEVLMIGDTEFDVKAARAADVKVVVLDWYKSYVNQLPKPDYKFVSISEKLEHFGWVVKEERV